MRTRLNRSFFDRDTIEVARDLLGQRLVHVLADGARLSGRIVETEAYLGLEDPACHSFSGRRTPRTEVMFGEPGHAYVYFIYGMHHCFNVITMGRDVPEAVLLRALDPVEGMERIRAPHPHTPPHLLANGPGKLCRAMGLTAVHNAVDLTRSDSLFIEEDAPVPECEIQDGPRIGLGERHDAVHWPLRFGIKRHLALSPPKFPDFGAP